MNYAVILAGGVGNRMKTIDIPKQYYEINGIPIIVYTLETFFNMDCFDYIYLAINFQYKEYVEKLLDKYFSNEDIILVEGGKERIDSIHNVIEAINEKNINDDDIIVIHDGVRPFVTEKIIKDNIKAAREYGACVTSVNVNDTMILSENSKYVDRIPIRSTLFNGQSPDSFNLKLFVELENNLTDNQRKIITGTSQVCTMNNYPLRMVEGDRVNFKITTDADLDLAEFMILKRGNDL